MGAMTTPMRAAAALVLALQLHQLALPAVCGARRPSSAQCHETQVAGGSQLVGQSSSHEPLCASPAMCGLFATGIPEVAIGLTAPRDRSVATFAVPRLLPSDPAPPLSPPPQA